MNLLKAPNSIAILIDRNYGNYNILIEFQSNVSIFDWDLRNRMYRRKPEVIRTPFYYNYRAMNMYIEMVIYYRDHALWNQYYSRFNLMDQFSVTH